MPTATPTPEETLAAYLVAEKEIVSGAQEVRINDRTYTRAQLSEVREGIRFWMGICNARAVGSGGLTFSTARFD